MKSSLSNTIAGHSGNWLGSHPRAPRRESAPSRHRRTPLPAGRPFCPLARLLTLLAGTANLVVAEAAAPGQVLWTFTTGAEVRSSPAIGADGTVYVGSQDGKVSALSSTSVGGLANSPWPKFRDDAQNTGQSPVAPPAVEWQSLVTVLTEGAEDRIAVQLSGFPQPRLQWFHNGVAVPGGTDVSLVFPAVTRALEGRYWVAASHWLGQATSAPIVAVVSNVDPRYYPGWWYEGAAGTRHRIEYVWSGSGWTNWVQLTELTLPATPFRFLDTDAFDHAGAVYRTTPVP